MTKNYPDDVTHPEDYNQSPEFYYTEIDAECQRCERYMVARAAVACGTLEILEILGSCKKCNGDLKEAT